MGAARLTQLPNPPNCLAHPLSAHLPDETQKILNENIKVKRPPNGLFGGRQGKDDGNKDPSD